MLDELRRTVEAIPGLACSALPDGELELSNRRWCEYTGATPEEARARGWPGCVSPDDADALAGFWRSLAAGGAPGETEARLRRWDGTYRWFQLRAVPRRDGAGALVGWYAQAADVDDRRRAEAILAGEKRLLEMVAWGCALPVVLDALCALVEDVARDCHCSVLLVDPRGTRFEGGASPSLPPGFHDTIYASPLIPGSGPCAAAFHQRSRVVVEDVASDPRWEGRWRDLVLGMGLRSGWTTPILSLAGKVLGTFALYRREVGPPTPLHLELTGRFAHVASIAVERAQGEAALRRSEAFLAEGQRLSSTGTFSWRVDTGEITWSEQTYRIYALDAARPVTMEMAGARVHPEDRELFREMVERGTREGSDLEFEHRLRMEDGSVRHLSVVARGTRDAAGRVEYIGAVQDITGRRRADDALAAARSEMARVSRLAALGELAAAIAHEVSQPLAGIVTNAGTTLRMLDGAAPDLEGAVDASRRAIRDARRAADVVARLRTLFGREPGAAEPVDLNEAAREVMALARGELQRARVSVRAELAPALPRVTGDRVQLRQVILNLLLNAVEAMGAVEGRPRLLAVRTREVAGGRVVLSVSDTGEGVDVDGAERLFDAFYTTRSGGMGMGLSISRSIVESHRGRLWAEPNDGPGATFSFSLPRAADPRAPASIFPSPAVSLSPAVSAPLPGADG